MARISLREYIHEIESLIDRGDTQKAIAQCKFILRYFPKHIDTYRLFGKALLEIQKFGDASDIFQRVLSSVPDDFISQIGMSIIREDENNLDAAIWHLERAFEIQPSNKAVQDELKRLYASRDGVTPTKIRLTRGALVRMYARGELYPQAIAEIKAALDEDQNRVDLEVILARLYFLLDQKLEAIETCSSLISKLPFCYEANRILAELLPATSRGEDAKIFRQRVIDLDPYFAFVSENTPNPIDIPDNKVMMEYFEWEPGMEEKEQEQPDWAKSIGINWDTDSTNESSQIESWLKSESNLQPADLKEENNKFASNGEFQSEITQTQNSEEILESENISPFVDSELENVQNKDENLPNWMVEAGWESSSEQNETIQKGFNLEIQEEPTEKTAETEDIVLGAIPDWIQKLAPKELHDLEDNENQPDLEFEVDRLNSIFASPKTTGSVEDSTVFEPITLGINTDDVLNQQIKLEDELSVESMENATNSDEFIRISYEENEFSNELISELPSGQDDRINENQKEFTGEIEFTDKSTSGEFPDTASEQFSSDEIEKLHYETSIINEYPESTVEKESSILDSQIEPPSELKMPQFDSENEMSWLQNLIHDEETPQILTTDELLSSDHDSESIKILSEREDVTKESEDDFSWLNALQMDVENTDLEVDDINLNIESIGDNQVAKNQDLIQENENLVNSDLLVEFENLAEQNAVGEESKEEIDAVDYKEFNSELVNPEIVDYSINLSENEQSEIFIDEDQVMEVESETKEISSEKAEILNQEPAEIENTFVNLPEDLIESKLEISDISLEEKTPDWIESLIKEIPEQQDVETISNVDQTEFVIEKDQKTPSVNELEIDEGGEIDAALAWMEGLAVKHGAEESSLFSKPEERDETPPDWIKAFQDEAEKDLILDNFVDSPKSENLFDDLDMTPSWLQELHLETSEIEEKKDEIISEKEEILDLPEKFDFQNEDLISTTEPIIDSSLVAEKDIESFSRRGGKRSYTG